MKNLACLSVSDEGCVLGLTCAEAVLVSGAVAVKGEGGTRESAACCCWDISEPAAPMVTAPAPDVGPSVPEKTPVIKTAMTILARLNAGQRKMMVLQVQLVPPLLLLALHYVCTLMHYFITCYTIAPFQILARRCCQILSINGQR